MNSLKPRRFGIELELSRRFLCVNHSERNYSVWWTEVNNLLERLHDNTKIQRSWKLKIDTSCGGEIVSPILLGADGLRQVALICQETKALADRAGLPAVDGECGLHLHFDAADMKPRQLSNLFILLHMAEPIIYSMYPARNPKYCAPIQVNMRLASRFRDWVDVRDAWYRGQNNTRDKHFVYSENFINNSQPGDHYDGTRYHGFNIHCYWKQGTVEFRYGSGTLDPLHIKAYYEMCLAMVNTAMTKKVIKIGDTTRDLKFDDLSRHYQENYRFRRIIRKLCNDCSFSRSTIKLIMSLVRKNKPYLLGKKSDVSHILITRFTAEKYYFRTEDGRHWGSNGGVLSSNTLLSYERECTLIDCEYDWITLDHGSVRLVSRDRRYIIKYNLRVMSPVVDHEVGYGEVEATGPAADAMDEAIWPTPGTTFGHIANVLHNAEPDGPITFVNLHETEPDVPIAFANPGGTPDVQGG